MKYKFSLADKSIYKTYVPTLIILIAIVNMYNLSLFVRAAIFAPRYSKLVQS
jgi:hypothetical protein